MADELSVADFFAFGSAAARATSDQKIREVQAGVAPSSADAEPEGDPAVR